MYPCITASRVAFSTQGLVTTPVIRRFSIPLRTSISSNIALYQFLCLRERYGFGDLCALEGGERVDVLLLSEDVRLEAWHRPGTRRCFIKCPLACDRPHGMASSQGFLIVDVLVASEPDVDRLPEQSRHLVPDVLAGPSLDYQVGAISVSPIISSSSRTARRPASLVIFAPRNSSLRRWCRRRQPGPT